MDFSTIIKVARGEKQADLLFKNARIINVFSGEIVSDNIAVAGGYIAGFGNYSAKKVVDIGGCFVAPGFIDAHVHIESAMTCITEFARAVLPCGTTTVVADPHEIANVLGTTGIEYMLQSAKHQPINIYFTLSSCVPATDMETSGAKLGADDLFPFMNNERIVALAEMMDYPGVIHGNPEVLKKIELAKEYGKPVDGHAPELSGKDLYAYIAAGVESDHECTTAQEAKEKLMAGMHIMIREGTIAKNLSQLLPVVNERTSRRMMWCTDDRHPNDILKQGDIDSIVRESIRSGLDPVLAVQMATINSADYFGIKEVGAIAPGRLADMIVLSDLAGLDIKQVYCRGVLTAENGEILPGIEKPAQIPVLPSMNVDIKKLDFSIPADGQKIRIIDIVPGRLITHQRIENASVVSDFAVSDTSRDLLKIAVVERHKGSGNIGKGFARGFGLKYGAVASSVAHDSHNIIVVGTNDEDMKEAVKTVVKMGGGLCVACAHKTSLGLPLPIAGLMSHEPVKKVRDQLNSLIGMARELGAKLKDPFMALSFLALPVIPELKITDKGLVDVVKFQIVPLFVKE